MSRLMSDEMEGRLGQELEDWDRNWKIGTGIGRLGHEWELHRLEWEWESYGSRVTNGPERW